MGVEDILIQTKQNIERLINGKDRNELLRQSKLGFVESWHSIGEKASLLTMLNEKELDLLESLLKEDSMKVVEIYA